MKRVLSLFLSVLFIFSFFSPIRAVADNSNQVFSSPVSVGDIITLGTYEQDNNSSNGAEPIEWQVIETDNNKALLISKYVLDARSYNLEDVDITWEKCSLREWLNESFYNAAFSMEEKKSILNTNISADKNPDYIVNLGSATKDCVFLLSISEAEKFFPDMKDRKCVPTEYALAKELWVSDEYSVGERNTCWWWLRTPGYIQKGASYIYYDGAISTYGLSNVFINVGVRPALWVSFQNKSEDTAASALGNSGPSVEYEHIILDDFDPPSNYKENSKVPFDNNNSGGSVLVERKIIDIDRFMNKFIEVYSTLNYMLYLNMPDIRLNRSSISYPTTVQLLAEETDGTVVNMGYLSFCSSSYDNEEGGSMDDIDYVRYIFPNVGWTEQNKMASLFFNSICASIIQAMDIDRVHNSFEQEYAENSKADEIIAKLFTIDPYSLGGGFQGESFEIGDYKYMLRLQSPDENGQFSYILEGGPKDLLFGIFWTREKIRQIAGMI